jgi:hypothetical protein
MWRDRHRVGDGLWGISAGAGGSRAKRLIQITLCSNLRSRIGIAPSAKPWLSSQLRARNRAASRRTLAGQIGRHPSRASWSPPAFDQANKTTAAGSAASTVCKSLAHRMGRPWVPAVFRLHLHAVCLAHQRMRAEHVVHRNDLKPRRRQPAQGGGDVSRPNSPR